MTDTNTTPAEAVERVSDAMWDALGVAAWESNGTVIVTEADWDDMVTAAIEAHTAWLWERAMSDEVVEAAARTWFQSLGLTNADIEWNDDRGVNLTNDEYSKWETEPVDVEEFMRGPIWIELPCGGQFFYEDFKFLFGSTAALTTLLGPRPEAPDAN